MTDKDWTCSCRARIYDRPVLPNTKKLAKEQGMDVDVYIRDRGVADENICFLTGRVCPTSKDCDAKISLGQIEKEFDSFYNEHLIGKPSMAKFFIGLLCESVCEAVRGIPTETLYGFMSAENMGGLQRVLVGELSLRKKEITKWDLVVKDNLEIIMETYPVNYPRVVPISIKRFAINHIQAVLEDV